MTTAPEPTDASTQKEARLRRKSLALSVLVPVYNERHLVEASLRRVLALSDPRISRLEVIVVDDGSTDGSGAILDAIAASDARVVLVRHAHNQGKGAAVRTAIARATGDVAVCHDSDLEYDPADLPRLLVPFLEEGADAVFGSRYLAGEYRRALMYRHSLMNKGLTVAASWLTDLALTDLETCYKLVRTPLLQSIPLREDDFRIEVELAFKLAKRGARLFEAPIRYVPRSYREGKKIRPLDGVKALAAMARFSLVDDIYKHDAYGTRILAELEKARRFNAWMADVLRPHLGDRVLEIGAGIGNMTAELIPRERYVASDINPHYLDYLRSWSIGKPYLETRHVDASNPADFVGLEGAFDTVVMCNVLEHVPDPVASLRAIRSALAPGGRLVVLVPQHPALYGTLDVALDHVKRYTAAELDDELRAAGFGAVDRFDFNRFSAPAWWFNGKVLRRKTFSRFQLKVLNTLVPAIRAIDRHLPWSGQSLIAIAER